MRNRHKTLLRDHSVVEVTPKAYPKHYSVSVIPETLIVRGPKRPPNWDCQFNDTLGLPLKLRNRVSDPGTPPVRASPKAPGYGGGARGATVNIGSGPRLYTVTEDTKGNSTGEAEELLLQ